MEPQGPEEPVDADRAGAQRVLVTDAALQEMRGPSEHDLFGDLTEQSAWENAVPSVPRHGAAADGAPTSDEELLPGTPREPGAHRRRLDMDGAAAPGAPAAADPGPAAASPRRRNADGPPPRLVEETDAEPEVTKAEVTADVGGMREALEQARRRAE